MGMDKIEGISEYRFICLDEIASSVVNTFIFRVLSAHNRLYLLYPLLTIMRELMSNAMKANAKRVFFNANGLDPEKEEDYERGLSMFRDFVIGNFAGIYDFLSDSDYSILFSVKHDDHGGTFELRNNVPLLPKERCLIDEKMKQMELAATILGEFDRNRSSREGAGLGIMLILSCLRNMGCPDNCFSLEVQGEETVARVHIPWTLQAEEVSRKIKDLILDEIDLLPAFPENLAELIDMCRDSSVTIRDLGSKVRQDVGLVADILKMANCAGFISMGRVSEIERAILTIGMKNLEGLLLTSGVRNIISNRYSHFEEVWRHCNRVASYAGSIAEMYSLNREREQASLAGLLHDLGKVILLSVGGEAAEKISQIASNLSLVSTNIIEEISIGISHSEIGKLAAQKWNLPDFLMAAIGSHHTPGIVEEEFGAVVKIVNLADLFCGVESLKYSYSYVDFSVKEFFDIRDAKHLAEIHARVRKLAEEKFII